METLLAVDVNPLQDEHGCTALMMASENGHIEIVKLLLATENVDVYLQDEKGETAYDYATDTQQEQIIRLLGKYAYTKEKE